MSCRRASLVCALTLVGAAAAGGGSSQLPAEIAFSADDECLGGDEACAWHALQLRGKRAAPAPATAEDEDVAAPVDDAPAADEGAKADAPETADGDVEEAAPAPAPATDVAPSDAPETANGDVEASAPEAAPAPAPAPPPVATAVPPPAPAPAPAPRTPAAHEVDCHDVQEGEVGLCMNSIRWARDEGYPKHPDWYHGLTPATASLADWQMFAWNTTHPTCPRPCSAKWDISWCDAPEAPKLWAPKLPAEPVTLRIMSYNLFWWYLFNVQGGASADSLIKAKSDQEPYDVIGLQECEDPDRVFKVVGLDRVYSAFLGSRAVCVAYKTATWELLDHGEDEVAMDMRTEFYGHRVAQWVRLKHKENGMTMLFVNHHGPLSVNSGGACGGQSTAHNLLKVMAKRGQPGDLLVLAGDFNANAASQTVQSLWPHLLHVYNSPSFGGVDNIFANIPRDAVQQANDLGSGGSDHHAIEVVLRFPVAALSKATTPIGLEPGTAVTALENAMGSDGCLLEPKQLYVYAETAWAVYKTNIVDPRVCCNACQGMAGCTAWVWEEWNVGAKGPLCTLRQGQPLRVDRKTNAVSGLPHGAAVKSALSKSSAR